MIFLDVNIEKRRITGIFNCIVVQTLFEPCGTITQQLLQVMSMLGETFLKYRLWNILQ